MDVIRKECCLDATGHGIHGNTNREKNATSFSADARHSAENCTTTNQTVDRVENLVNEGIDHQDNVTRSAVTNLDDLNYSKLSSTHALLVEVDLRKVCARGATRLNSIAMVEKIMIWMQAPAPYQ